jgi:hypothetical protein
MELNGGKPKPLISGSFNGVQNAADGGGGPWGGPDDVYYDADSHTLLFSGGAMPSGVYAKILPIDTGQSRKLSVPDANPAAPATLCGSPQDPQKPEFYIAAAVDRPTFEWRIWFSNSYSLHPDRVLVASPERYLQFPRVSPDGKKLLYLSMLGETGLSEIMLYDLELGRQSALVTLSSQWEAGFYPAMGCPFSWSPDGKQIAYADGSKIKIVEVNSEDPGSK